MALRVGLVGCGNISGIYLANSGVFRDYRIVAVSDIRPEVAAAVGQKHDLPALSVGELLKRDDIDAVLNLTVPLAHAEVSLAAIDAGKHIYSEKPLATTLADGRAIIAAAAARGVRVGSAPDTVLSAGIQRARALIDAGRVGMVGTGTAAVMSRGMEHWHPNPDFFFKKGGGPVLDVGPYYIAALVALLGPIREVRATGRIGRRQRLVTAPGPMQGEKIDVEVLTTVNALLSFENGADVVFIASWDVLGHSQRPLELHGLSASLRVPDPNFFGGDVEINDGTGWQTISTDADVFGRPNWRGKPEEALRANYRGLGLAELGAAVREGRKHRLNGDFALHVLSAMLAIGEAAVEGRAVRIIDQTDGLIPLAETEAASLI